MSEVSVLQERIPETLLRDDERLQVVLIDSKEQKRYEISAKDANPFAFDLSRFVPSDGVFDLPRLWGLTSDLLDHIQEREGVVEAERILLKEAFNIDEFHKHGDEVITYRVIKREPGKMNTKATGRPQRRHQYAYDLNRADDPNKVIVVDSRPIDHDIEFSVWAKTAPMANSRILWLERNLIDHSWAYLTKGVEKFYWTHRSADTFSVPNGQRIYQRPLRFFVRLREFHVVAHPALRQIQFDVTLTDDI